jgi:uncharacterized protein YgbK (DUF1537 family)
VLGIVADDLTGAGDASVQFAKRGWCTLLTLEAIPAAPGAAAATPLVPGFRPAVLAVTTDCRALPNDTAETLTARAVRALIDAGVDRMFLKIDSTMRGSVEGQVAGALTAWRTRHPDARAVVCPAYPAMGRTVESHRLLVKGEPVERTPFGRDPVSPVRTSDMTALLPRSPSVGIVDAVTDADLMTIAASISGFGAAAIAVGSGGLADAIAQTWPGRPPAHALTASDIIPKVANPRILLQVSSLNPVSHAQTARLKSVFPDVAVLLPPEDRGDSTVVARNLARASADRLARAQWDVLGLVGGDGARETLAQLGASGIRIVDSLLEGIPFGLIVGGSADGMPVFTKAGGFGAEDALVRCVERMRP